MIAPVGLGANAPTIQQGLLPEWLGCREILLHRGNPYRPQMTRQIQLAVYGKTQLLSDEPRNQHRFAYPVFFAFLFFPLALLPFPVAQFAALLAGLVLTAISIPLWLRGESLSLCTKLTCTLLALATYPVVLGLQLRQPTLIIAGLLAVVFFCVRAGHLRWAGILAALSCSKPQLAIAVLLPLAIWSIAAWRTRKSFLLSLGLSLAALLLLSEVVVGAWISPWLDTLRAYSHYAGGRPLLADLLRGYCEGPATALLVGVVVWISFKFNNSDLLFTVAFSTAAFQLLFPFQIYNSALLLPAALWMAANYRTIQARGQFFTLLGAGTWIVLGTGWGSGFVLSLASLVSPGAAVKLWQLPLLAAYVYPFAIFKVLSSYGMMALPAWRGWAATVSTTSAATKTSSPHIAITIC